MSIEQKEKELKAIKTYTSNAIIRMMESKHPSEDDTTTLKQINGLVKKYKKLEEELSELKRQKKSDDEISSSSANSLDR